MTQWTPQYDHCLTEPRLRASVYEPEADTFLLVEALDQDTARLRAMRPRRCLEVGCGSGVAITHLATLLLRDTDATEARADSRFYATDVNPVALEATALTWQCTLQKLLKDNVVATASQDSSCGTEARTRILDPAFIDFSEDTTSALVLTLLRGDLLGPFVPDGAEAGAMQFDVVLFNPPYVPTSTQELQEATETQGADMLRRAWCGGPRGRVVLDRFLAMLPAVLSMHGVCYIVLIRENDEEDVARVVQDCFRASTANLALPHKVEEARMECVARRYTGEYLSVHRISRV